MSTLTVRKMALQAGQHRAPEQALRGLHASLYAAYMASR